MWIFSVRLAIGSFFFDADHETPLFVAKGQYCRGIHGVIEAPGLNLSELGFFSSSPLFTPMMIGPLQTQVTGEMAMRYHLRLEKPGSGSRKLLLQTSSAPQTCRSSRRLYSAAQASQQYPSNKSKIDSNTLALILRIPEKMRTHLQKTTYLYLIFR
jgi:hypothetical protein